ncbi:MAG: hypothetical protein IJX89_01480 [Alphaproteobacteria bacterium]|nr:hypothetical protein [Alphaproteobacteria bacterium]
MQLTGPEILRRMQGENPDIVITPFDMRCLGPNSYDLHLGDTLRVYKHTIPKGMRPAIPYKGSTGMHHMRDWFEDNGYPTMGMVDSEPYYYRDYLKHPEKYDLRNPRYLIDPTNPKHHETIDIKIPETGLVLHPMFGFLGSTVEYTETRNLIPHIDGKSSVGRNFIKNHFTAGRGDDGFCGDWTLEIEVLYPTVVYPYMRIGQIYYETIMGERMPYDKIKTSHYNGQRGPTAAAPIPIDRFLREKQK